jgi:hypothetical protein
MASLLALSRSCDIERAEALGIVNDHDADNLRGALVGKQQHA